MQSVWERDQIEKTSLPAVWRRAASDIIRRDDWPSLRRHRHDGIAMAILPAWAKTVERG
jgi:hypothetical protein